MSRSAAPKANAAAAGEGAPVSRLKVRAFAVSIDGFGAGPGQSLAHPLGVGGESLHKWFFPTRTFRQMLGGIGDEANRALRGRGRSSWDFASPNRWRRRMLACGAEQGLKPDR